RAVVLRRVLGNLLSHVVREFLKVIAWVVLWVDVRAELLQVLDKALTKSLTELVGERQPVKLRLHQVAEQPVAALAVWDWRYLEDVVPDLAGLDLVGHVRVVAV